MIKFLKQELKFYKDWFKNEPEFFIVMFLCFIAEIIFIMLFIKHKIPAAVYEILK